MTISDTHTAVIFTVDVEVGSYSRAGKTHDHQPQARIWGRLPHHRQQFGIGAICELMRQHNASATFFVDLCEAAHFGPELFAEACRYLHDQGQDVQLHTHPAWCADAKRWLMHQYDRREQRRIIRDGCEMLRSWLGRAPIAHRAGSFGADDNTLSAAAEAGLVIDASYAHRWPACKLSPPHADGNAAWCRAGVLELPVTTFSSWPFQKPGRPRHMDINSATLGEMKSVLRQAARKQVPFVVILLHSFSMVAMKRDGTYRPRRSAYRRLKRLMRFINSHPKLRVATVSDIHEQYKHRPQAILGHAFAPRVGIVTSYLRLWQRLGAGAANILAALGTLAAAAALGLLLLRLFGWLQ